MNNKQTKYRDIQHQLRETVRELFKLPDYAQVDINLVNMANFFPLISDLLNTYAPNSICEIGSDKGTTTELLKAYCKENQVALHIVDPALSDEVISNTDISYHRSMSIDFLDNEEPCDTYFIDGDHNYYTVLSELRLIRDKNTESNSKLLFMHDVSWFCGYLDMYYDETNIPEKARKATLRNKTLSMFKDNNVDSRQGLHLNMVTVAEDHNPKENGVLSAIDTFLEESSDWMYFSIPSIYGLGILWFKGNGCDETQRYIHGLSQKFQYFQPFLSILEFNRIFLLEKLHESGALWTEQKHYISDLHEKHDSILNDNHQLTHENNTLTENIQLLSEQLEESGLLWKEQDKYIIDLSGQLEESGLIWEEQSKHITDLTKTNHSLSDTIGALSEKLEESGALWRAQNQHIEDTEKELREMQDKINDLSSIRGWLRYQYNSIFRS